jgi:hypothetical protein
MRPLGVLRRSAHTAAGKQLLSGQPVGVIRGQEHGNRRDVMREMKWTEAEKKLSRRAFEVALQAELAEVLQELKAPAAAAQTPGDMWPIEHFLYQRRRELDAKYDPRYSQLVSVFGRLIREGRLTEAHFEGLSQDKLEFIRRIASF